MPYTHPLKVFLCHASADKSAVYKLYHYLRDRKMDPWLDAEKLLPGQNWQVEIPKALLSSDVIIICISKNSVDKEGFVQKEIKFALDKALEIPEGRIFLIPARLEECDLPHSLSTYHYVNLYEEDGYKKLLRSLRARAKQIGATKISVNQDTTPSPKKHLGMKLPLWGIGLIAFGIIIIFWNLYSISITPKPTQAPSATQTLFIATKTSTPSATQTLFVKPTTKTPLPVTSTSTVTSTKTATVIPTPTLGIGSTKIGDDGAILVYVPEGEFIRGSNTDYKNEKPERLVYLKAFWIDQTEVTNDMYERCVKSGKCSRDIKYHFSLNEGNRPAVAINWSDANKYCERANRRLPTEAEWEKAARGTDGRTYPWGDEKPNIDLLNFDTEGITKDVGSYLNGVSPYGAYDMAGNVWEWVNDWYREDYYEFSLVTNPVGPDSGQYRVLRGGSSIMLGNIVRSSYRRPFDPSNTNYDIGFRCAQDATP